MFAFQIYTKGSISPAISPGFKMMRLAIPRAIKRISLATTNGGLRASSTSAPEKVEVFIDDKRVLVDPGTTVLQVCYAVGVLKT